MYSAHVVLSFLLCCSASLEARQWTDVEGRTLQAEFVSAGADDVTVRLPDGRTASLPITRLSEEDRQFVRMALKSHKAAKGGVDEPLNFDAPWPSDVRLAGDPQIRTVLEDKENRKFVYESAHFRFVSDVRLSKQVVRSFSVMFECTYEYCRALPLAISGGVRTDGLFQILLFEKKEDYFKAGGPRGSAGVFATGLHAVMVPLESLGVRKVGNGYMLDRNASNRVLVHELTHQLTPLEYLQNGANAWFIEGLAEYVAATPYRPGVFRVKSNFDDIVEYATGYAKDDKQGRAMGREFSAPPLRKFMLMSYRDFTGNNANFNYGFGLLLTTYFFHLDGKGTGDGIKGFLKAIRSGKSGAKAMESLLAGRTFEQLQEDFAKAWKRKGLKITFPGGP